jgi:phospholipase/lecithinase/hemolysin
MRKTLMTVAAAAALAVATATPAFAFDGIVAFGDSLTDNGNLAAYGAAPGAPYWNGRFSNGPVAVEDMAASMHLGLQDFAYGGAQTGTTNLYPQLNGTGVAAQVAGFGAMTGGHADANSLYFVWAGPNDFFAGANMFNPATATAAAANFMADIQSLYTLGARDFLVPLMPDLGVTPSATATNLLYPGYAGIASQQSAAYDALLSASLQQFAATHAGVQMNVFDTAAFFAQQSATLASQGVNVTDSCFNAAAGTLCSNPDQYLFWDGVHPTAMGHELLGTAFAAAVPEPSSVALMLAGLGLVGWRARRRQSA